MREYNEAGVLQASFLAGDTPTDVTVGPDGNLYVANQTRTEADYAEIVKIDLTSGQRTVFATTGIEGVFSVSFGTSNDLFASSTWAGSAPKVTRYDGATGAVIGSFVPGPVESPSPAGLAFGPNGNLYVGEFGEVREYDGETGALVGVFSSGNGLGATNGLAFAPNGNLVVANTFSNDSPNAGVYEFDGSTGSLVRVFATDKSPVDLAFDDSGTVLFVSSNGNQSPGSCVARTPDAPGGKCRFVYRYNWATGALLGSMTAGGIGGGHGIAVYGTAVIPEPSTGFLVATGLVGLAAVRRWLRN